MKINGTKKELLKQILVYIRDPRVRFIIIGLQTEECTVELSQTAMQINNIKSKNFDSWFDKFTQHILNIYSEYYEIPDESKQEWYLKVTYYG